MSLNILRCHLSSVRKQIFIFSCSGKLVFYTYLERNWFFSKVAGSLSVTLFKIKSFISIFQGFWPKVTFRTYFFQNTYFLEKLSVATCWYNKAPAYVNLTNMLVSFTNLLKCISVICWTMFHKIFISSKVFPAKEILNGHNPLDTGGSNNVGITLFQRYLNPLRPVGEE